MAKTLFKYLDFKGGLAMLEHHNLQFTNATKFNDPFDCHPALFDYSNVPERPHNWPPADFLSKKDFHIDFCERFVDDISEIEYIDLEHFL